MITGAEAAEFSGAGFFELPVCCYYLQWNVSDCAMENNSQQAAGVAQQPQNHLFQGQEN